MHAPIRPHHGLRQLLLTAMACALTACGGGASSPDNNGDVQPQSGAQAGHFTVAPLGQQDSSSTIGGPVVSTGSLAIVDLNTGQVARTLAMGTLDDASAGWATTDRVVAKNATTRTLQGLSQLFYLQNHQLWRLDLRGDTLGNPVPVSALTNVCRIRKARSVSLAGNAAWLEVATAAPNDTCAHPAAYVNRLVWSQASASDSGVLAGDTGLTWVAAMSEGPQTPVTMVMVIDRTQGANAGVLKLVSPDDLRQTLSTVDVGHLLAAGETVTPLANLPTDPVRSLLLVGQRLHLATQSGTRVTLSPVLTELTVSGRRPTTTDGASVFFMDGPRLLELTPQGRLNLRATLGPEQGSWDAPAYTQGHLVMTQTGGTSGPASAVVALNLNSGAVITLAAGDSEASVGLIAAQDGQAWVLRIHTSTATDPNAFDLQRVTVEHPSDQALVGQHVNLIGFHFSPDTDTTQPRQALHLLWCHASATMGCEGSAVYSQSLTGTRGLYNLGVPQADADSTLFLNPSSMAADADAPVQPLLAMQTLNKAPYTNKLQLYLAQPGLFGSLQLVTLTPPAP